MIPIEEIIKGGGGESPVTQRIRHAFADQYHWTKHRFEIQKIVDGIERESISHEIDHVKKFENGTIAFELEWNNKDPFFDRDLENFKRLHADGVISVGGILTRGESLHESLENLVLRFAQEANIHGSEQLERYYRPTRRQIELAKKSAMRTGSFAAGWSKTFVSDKFGEATTHWRKLYDRVKRGVGNPCPLLLIGIPSTVIHFP